MVAHIDRDQASADAPFTCTRYRRTSIKRYGVQSVLEQIVTGIDCNLIRIGHTHKLHVIAESDFKPDICSALPCLCVVACSTGVPVPPCAYPLIPPQSIVSFQILLTRPCSSCY